MSKKNLTLEGFIEFLKTKDPKETYRYGDVSNCAVAQYYKSVGCVYIIAGAMPKTETKDSRVFIITEDDMRHALFQHDKDFYIAAKPLERRLIEDAAHLASMRKDHKTGGTKHTTFADALDVTEEFNETLREVLSRYVPA